MEAEQLAQLQAIPPGAYWVAFFTIVSSLGSIFTCGLIIFKGVWWASKTDSVLKRNKADTDNAHAKIREVKVEMKKIWEAVWQKQ